MINQKNYFSEVEKIGLKSLPDPVQKMHDIIVRATSSGSNWDKVMKSDKEGLIRMINTQFETLQKLIDKAKPANVPVEDARKPENKDSHVCIMVKLPGKDRFVPVLAEASGNYKLSDIMNCTLWRMPEYEGAKAEANNLAAKKPGAIVRVVGGDTKNIYYEITKEAAPAVEKEKAAPAAVKAEQERESPKVAKEKKPKAEKAPKVKAPKEKKPTKAQQQYDRADKVPHFDPAMRLIRRFANFDGKKATVKKLLDFIKALQKAFADKTVSKSHEHASLLLKIQDAAMAQYKAAEKSESGFVLIEFESKWAKGLHELAESEAVMPTVPLLKRYIGFLGIKPTLEKVEELLKAIKAAFASGKITDGMLHRKELVEVQQALEDYIAKRRSSIEVSPATLNGLEGIFGKKLSAAATNNGSGSVKGYIPEEVRLQQLAYNLEPVVNPRSSNYEPLAGTGLGSVATAYNTASYSYDAAVMDEPVGGGSQQAEEEDIFADRVSKTKPLRLPGELGRFMGAPEPLEYALVLRGDPGAGKSRLLFQLQDLFAGIGMTVADFSLEMSKQSSVVKGYEAQYIHASNRVRIKRADYLPKGLQTIREQAASGKFNVIVIDSFGKVGAKQEEFDKLRKDFPNIIWLVIFQSTTNGTARGGVQAEYDGGAVIHVHEGGIAVFEKNRYHTDESMNLAYKVFERKAVPRQSVSV